MALTLFWRIDCDSLLIASRHALHSLVCAIQFASLAEETLNCAQAAFLSHEDHTHWLLHSPLLSPQHLLHLAFALVQNHGHGLQYHRQ